MFNRIYPLFVLLILFTHSSCQFIENYRVQKIVKEMTFLEACLWAKEKRNEPLLLAFSALEQAKLVKQKKDVTELYIDERPFYKLLSIFESNKKQKIDCSKLKNKIDSFDGVRIIKAHQLHLNLLRNFTNLKHIEDYMGTELSLDFSNWSHLISYRTHMFNKNEINFRPDHLPKAIAHLRFGEFASYSLDDLLGFPNLRKLKLNVKHLKEFDLDYLGHFNSVPFPVYF
jgi:hypothetical protein